jgi:hypothetical protein
MASSSGEHYPQQSTREFVCGASAGMVESCITFPLQKLIFRQQLHYIVAKKAVAHMADDGWHRLYRGLLPPLCQVRMSFVAFRIRKEFLLKTTIFFAEITITCYHVRHVSTISNTAQL